MSDDDFGGSAGFDDFGDFEDDFPDELSMSGLTGSGTLSMSTGVGLLESAHVAVDKQEDGPTSYIVLELDTLHEREMFQVANRLATTYCMTEEEVLHILCALEWVESKLTEASDPGALRVQHGLPADPSAPHIGTLPSQQKTDLECCLCWEDGLSEQEVFALSCNHVLCLECWQLNVTSHLNEYRPTDIQCPVPGCTMCLFGSLVKRVHPEQYERYTRILGELFVKGNRRFVYCPNPKCDLVVKRTDMFSNDQMTCRCGRVFCFSCRRLNITENADGHYPATCEQFKQWSIITSGGLMNFRQKPCPNEKCRCPIIKCGCPENGVICDDKEYCPNQCCNHMQCPQCRMDFCWICMKAWDDHNDWYNCKFTPPEKQKNRTFVDEQLEAVLKYQDYNGNHMGLLDGREWAAEAFEQLVEEGKTTKRENFLLDACSELAMCYHTLRNSYVSWYYEYHCSDEKAPKSEHPKNITFFEHLQSNLEAITGMLSVVYEKEAKAQFENTHDLDPLLIQKLIDLTHTVHNYRLAVFKNDDEDQV